MGIRCRRTPGLGLWERRTGKEEEEEEEEYYK